jgi:uncharacterized membrane protein
MNELWRLYQESRAWADLAEDTRKDYEQAAKPLLKVFGAMPPASIKPAHIARYMRVERADAPKRANKEKALLSNLFNVGIERGDLETNPCKQVRKNKEKPRNEAPSSNTLAVFLEWAWAQSGQSQVLAGMAGLFSGLIAAMAYIQVAELGRQGEPVERTVFYFSLAAAASGALVMLLTGTSEWVWPQAWLLLPIGILAAMGQWCMTRAYNDGATMVVANLQYSGIVFSAMFGLFLFGDQIPWIGWGGILIIVSSAIAATALNARNKKNSLSPFKK